MWSLLSDLLHTQCNLMQHLQSRILESTYSTTVIQQKFGIRTLDTLYNERNSVGMFQLSTVYKHLSFKLLQSQNRMSNKLRILLNSSTFLHHIPNRPASCWSSKSRQSTRRIVPVHQSRQHYQENMVSRRINLQATSSVQPDKECKPLQHLGYRIHLDTEHTHHLNCLQMSQRCKSYMLWTVK
jgi:hypothetical protein